MLNITISRPGSLLTTIQGSHAHFVCIAELSAAAVLINFWEPSSKVNNAVWIVICLLVAVGINLLGAGQLDFLSQNSHKFKII